MDLTKEQVLGLIELHSTILKERDCKDRAHHLSMLESYIKLLEKMLIGGK